MPAIKTALEDQVCTALCHGMPPALVAQRLDCTERYVRKLRSKHAIGTAANPLWGTPDERPAIWRIYADMGVAPSRIAYIACRSRQAVHAYLNAP